MTVIALTCAIVSGQEIKNPKAFLERYDKNKNGEVTSDEFKDLERFKELDKNKDGKLTAADFLAPPSAKKPMGEKPSVPVVKYEGFKSLPRFDFDRDGQLAGDELKMLLLVTADRDEDLVINETEALAMPVPFGADLREGWFIKEWRPMDKNDDGVVVWSELKVPSIALGALDRNRDGKVGLDELVKLQASHLGGWIPKFAEQSAALAKAQSVKKANWISEPKLFGVMDANNDNMVTVAEFDRYVRGLRDALSLAPDFITRFDLDGDARVSLPEWGGAAGLFARLDKDGDGFVTIQDRQ